MIPDSLRDWRTAAERFSVAPLVVRADFRDFTGGLADSQIDELGEFYERALLRGDLHRLNQWFAGLQAKGEVNPVEHLVRKLLLVFDHLGMRGYMPFRRYDYRRVVPAQLDWSKLPPELSFLAGPAEKYQGVIFDEQQEEFVMNLAPAERAELRLLDDQRRAVGLPVIREWYLRMGAREHREAALVENLGRLITRALPDRYPV